MHPMGRGKLNSTCSLRACVYPSLHTHMVPLKIVVHEFADGSERPRSYVVPRELGRGWSRQVATW
jgi:hypothetical protein